MRGRVRLVCVAAITALALAGCGGSADQPGNGTESVASGAASGDQATRAKLDAYTAGYNKLLDTFGLPATEKAYVEKEIPTKSPSDSISVTTGWLEQGAGLLKTARAMPGGPADVNAAADALIGALDTVLKRLSGLNVYYESGAYREDGLARGKSEDAAMKAEFKAATEAMQRFDALLDRERKAVAASDLAALKANGNLLGYNTKLALQQSETLVEMFKSEADINNAAVIARADAQVATLEKTLADQRAALEKAKAAAKPESPVDVNYGLVVNTLTSLVGDYRDLKQSKDPSDYNDLVDHYNDAVDDANDIST